MADPLTFFVAGQPVPQGSHIAQATKDGKAYLRESNGERLRPWRAEVKRVAKEAMAGRTKFVGPLVVVLTFALERPKSHEGGPTWPATAPDQDKLARAVNDSMTKTVYYDDGQIVSSSVRKVWAGYDVEYPPGVLVWVNHVPGYVQPDVLAL
jgi:Holliday junction resolvase RusA-like endonuclease